MVYHAPRKGETNDFPSSMRKYINNYLKYHWKRPCKRRPKAGTSRDSFSVADSVSTLTGCTTGNPSLSNIQGDDSSSFDVMVAMKASTNDSTKSHDATLVHTRNEYTSTRTTSEDTKTDNLPSTKTPYDDASTSTTNHDVPINIDILDTDAADDFSSSL